MEGLFLAQYCCNWSYPCLTLWALLWINLPLISSIGFPRNKEHMGAGSQATTSLNWRPHFWHLWSQNFLSKWLACSAACLPSPLSLSFLEMDNVSRGLCIHTKEHKTSPKTGLAWVKREGLTVHSLPKSASVTGDGVYKTHVNLVKSTGL